MNGRMNVSERRLHHPQNSTNPFIFVKINIICYRKMIPHSSLTYDRTWYRFGCRCCSRRMVTLADSFCSSPHIFCAEHKLLPKITAIVWSELYIGMAICEAFPLLFCSVPLRPPEPAAIICTSISYPDGIANDMFAIQSLLCKLEIPQRRRARNAKPIFVARPWLNIREEKVAIQDWNQNCSRNSARCLMKLSVRSTFECGSRHED